MIEFILAIIVAILSLFGVEVEFEPTPQVDIGDAVSVTNETVPHDYALDELPARLTLDALPSCPFTSPVTVDPPALNDVWSGPCVYDGFVWTTPDHQVDLEVSELEQYAQCPAEDTNNGAPGNSIGEPCVFYFYSVERDDVNLWISHPDGSFIDLT